MEPSTETAAEKIWELVKEHGQQLPLAESAGISPQYLNDFLFRRRRLGGRAALRLSVALKGQFSVEELLAVEPLSLRGQRRLSASRKRDRERAA